MDRDVQIFNFEDCNVRIVDNKGDPWFVAKDVCRILGIGNTSQAVSALDSDEKVTITFNDSEGKPHKLLIISESGLYHLVGRSSKPKAKEFSRWVRKDVLPSIRKKGFYAKTEMTELQILQQSVNALVKHEEQLKEHEGKLDSLDGRVSHIEERHERAEKSLKGTRLSRRQLKPLTTRAKINMAIREFCINNGTQFDNVWNALYRQVYYRHGVNLKVRAKNKKISKLDIAEELGLLDKMWDILSHMIQQSPEKLKVRTKAQRNKDREWMMERRKRAEEEEEDITEDTPEKLH